VKGARAKVVNKQGQGQLAIGMGLVPRTNDNTSTDRPTDRPDLLYL